MVHQHSLHEVIFLLIFLSLSQPNITFSFVILHEHLMRLNDKAIQSWMGRGSQVPPPHSVANGRAGTHEDRKTLSSVMQPLQSYQSCSKQHHTFAQVYAVSNQMKHIQEKKRHGNWMGTKWEQGTRRCGRKLRQHRGWAWPEFIYMYETLFEWINW